MRAARRAVGFGADRATDRASAFVDNPPIVSGRIYHCTPEARICDRAVPCGASAGVADQAGKPKGCVAVVNEERAVSTERDGRPSTADRRQRTPPRGALWGLGRFGGGLSVGLGDARVGRRWPSWRGSGRLGWVGGLRRGRLPAGAWGRSAVWPCEVGDAWAGAPAGPEKAGVSRRASAGSPRLSSGRPGWGPGPPGCWAAAPPAGARGRLGPRRGTPWRRLGENGAPAGPRAQGRGPSPGSGADYCALHGDA